MLKKINLLCLIIFSLAFAFVEATVVYYLWKIFGHIQAPLQNDYHIIVDLGLISLIYPKKIIFENSQIHYVETIRELSTIIMLISVAYLSGKKFYHKIGAFLIAFSVWDIFYYLFLKVLTNWPKTIFDVDVYFLIPFPWIGPVLTPLIIFSIFFIVGLKLYLKK